MKSIYAVIQENAKEFALEGPEDDEESDSDLEDSFFKADEDIEHDDGPGFDGREDPRNSHDDEEE